MILDFGNRNICKDHHFLIVNSDCLSSKTRIPHLMSYISMSNVESLIYVLVSWVFHNVHFRNFRDLKMQFLLIRHRVLLFNDFGYTCVGIRNIWKHHLFLNVNSVCFISNTRIPHLISCISISNEDSLINVLVSWVYINVHFRHFGGWKCVFCLYVNGFIKSMILDILVLGLEISQRPQLSHCKLRLLE